MYKVANGVRLEKQGLNVLTANILSKGLQGGTAGALLGSGIGALAAGKDKRLAGALKGGLIGGGSGAALGGLLPFGVIGATNMALNVDPVLMILSRLAGRKQVSTYGELLKKLYKEPAGKFSKYLTDFSPLAGPTGNL